MQQFNLSKGMNLLYLSWGVNPTSKTVQLVNFIHASIEVSDLVPPLQGEGVLDANIVKHSRSEYQGLVMSYNVYIVLSVLFEMHYYLTSFVSTF